MTYLIAAGSLVLATLIALDLLREHQQRMAMAYARRYRSSRESRSR